MIKAELWENTWIGEPSLIYLVSGSFYTGRSHTGRPRTEEKRRPPWGYIFDLEPLYLCFKIDYLNRTKLFKEIVSVISRNPFKGTLKEK